MRPESEISKCSDDIKVFMSKCVNLSENKGIAIDSGLKTILEMLADLYAGIDKHENAESLSDLTWGIARLSGENSTLIRNNLVNELTTLMTDVERCLKKRA